MLRNNMPEEQKNHENPSQNWPVPGRQQPGWPTMLWTVLLLSLLFYWVGGRFLFNNDPLSAVDYSTFRRQVMANNVTRVTVTGSEIRGQFGEAVQTAAAEEPITEFATFVPSFGDEQLLALLEEHDVALTVRPVAEFSFWSIVLSLLPILFIVGLFYYFSRRMRQQGQSIFAIGRNRATLFDREHVQTTFADVAGLQGAKTELREIIAYLKAPERVQRLGGEAPKGILLIGPPGTGKTLLARAVAGEAEVPFYSMTGSDFMEMFVGVGASRVRNLFDDARQAAPCIIFIDELDSIGRRRGAGLGGGHDEREQTLNQLLSEMDGFEPSENIVVMAATNRPD
ncbi:MAG: ATP-dependent metallopeptidase FtsH/Yme1/Tma family protein, partial [Anaerolineales bacterium]|nr:ATP-dependent metallopeptidase FtsH/Yme1/Tma family protein [Anaerolineales bacterium]